MSTLSTHQLNIQINQQTICEQLDLNIAPGQIWGVLGRNGAGKTTLLHTLAGLRPAQSGNIKLDDTPLDQLSRKQVAQHIGLLLQQTEESFPATVLEVVLTGRHPHITTWSWESQADIEIARQALRQVQLEHMMERPVDQLSGGERQRVALASLIAQSPQIYLLDEPNSHLDLKYQIQSLNYFQQLCQQSSCSIVMSLHDMYLAQAYCSHLLLLFENGETIAGECNDLLTLENLNRLYQQRFIQVESEQGLIFIPDTQ